MKARLALEVFGENTRAKFAAARQLFKQNNAERTFNRAIGMPPRSCWVAEITGISPIYKYEREFLPRKLDYTNANSVGSRGVVAEYILESERIYEVKEQVSWSRTRRYFCAVSDEGDIVVVPEEYVQEYFEEDT